MGLSAHAWGIIQQFPGILADITYRKRSISSSLSLVNTSGNAGLRGIVFEPTAWKTARFSVVQAGLYRSITTIYEY